MFKHPYLSDNTCIIRLLEEYRQHKSLVIAYDFDNCVFDYHAKGHDYTEVIDLIRDAHKYGFHLIVFTAERDTDKVRTYLQEHNIPFHSINENPPFFQSDARKIYFNLLLDDRAGLRSAYIQLKAVINHLKNTQI